MVSRKFNHQLLLLVGFGISALFFTESAIASNGPAGMIGSAQELALSNALTWRRGGLKLLYDRIDATRLDEQRSGRWSVNQYRSWDLGGVRCDHQFVLVGYDYRFKNDLIVGTAVDFGRGSAYLKTGSLGNQAVSGSLYMSYPLPDDSYLGALMRVGVLRLSGSMGEALSKSTLHGASLGVEYGKSIEGGRLLKFEPQLRITYSRLDDHVFPCGNSRIRYEAIDDLVTALKFKGEVTIEENTRAYVSIGYYRDWLGQTAGRGIFSDGKVESFSRSLSKEWGRTGFGASYQSDRSIRATLQAERTYGQEFGRNIRLSSSVSYTY